ncbi:BREX-1 system phosphatase PglZ type A [Lewinella cohaerens]|uniref:BREX-1 system phosphatase PglZ type A n=1 Tax=Lewinella cohaerens TaxID=70995 RepID=UPI000372E82A|nr:BREX-1 system phosphatase PglZ type A [Lewinella cohaerens]
MNRIEASLNILFQTHRVIFWYDKEEKMRPEYEQISLEGIEKLEVSNNEFAVKARVLQSTQPDDRLLLYFPQSEPPMEQNWLLDLQLAHKVFHTDQEALYLQDLGLDYLFKELVQQHLEFFESKERRAQLRELLAEGDQEPDLRFKMMAVVFGTEYPNLEAYIQVYAGAFVDENNRIERDLERFRLREVFWREVSRKFNYPTDEKTGIYDFLLDVFARNFSPLNAGRSIKETRILLSLWKDAISYQETFRRVSAKIASDLLVVNLLEDCELEPILSDDLFELVDRRIIYLLATRLASGAINLPAFLGHLKLRENKFWYADYADFYTCLEQGALLLDKVQRAEEVNFSSVEDAARQYAQELHLIDYHYRKFVYHYRQTNQNAILAPLEERIRKVYSNDWLLKINHQLQDRINEMDHWIQRSPQAQSNFFVHHVEPVTSRPSRLFVIISDALRYENGWELCQKLQGAKRYEAEMDYLITSLPSYTQLGMAALLPHRKLAIKPEDGQVLADGMSTLGLQGRNKVLEANAGVRTVAINAEDFMKMNASTEGRAFVKQYDLIYIYHNRIDKAGDDTTSEDKVFEAVEKEISFLQDLLRKIGNMNGNNIYITADHGYLYQHEQLEESEFTKVDLLGEDYKINRRFVLGKGNSGTVPPALKLFTAEQLGLEPGVEVLITKGINRLRVRGAGSRYVHGGASLQEIVVPLVKVARKREDTTRQVEVDIIKSTDKITTNLLGVSFLQQELVSDKILPRQLRIYLRAEDGTKLSDIFNYTFDATEGSERQREVKHRFQLSSQASGKYKNQRISLVLEEPVAGSSRWKEYESYFYYLNISFTNDFDDF